MKSDMILDSWSPIAFLNHEKHNYKMTLNNNESLHFFVESLSKFQ
jgi:hypothetical protein